MASAYFPNTHPVKINDGSAAAPAYTFTGDTDTGIYRDATGPKVAVSIGGVKKFEIGTTSVTTTGEMVCEGLDAGDGNIITTGLIKESGGAQLSNGAISGVTSIHCQTAVVSSSLTCNATCALDGGLTVDGTKFTVADTTGNTGIDGTLTVGGEATFNAGINVVASDLYMPSADFSIGSIFSGGSGDDGLTDPTFKVLQATGNTTTTGTITTKGSNDNKLDISQPDGIGLIDTYSTTVGVPAQIWFRGYDGSTTADRALTCIFGNGTVVSKIKVDELESRIASDPLKVTDDLNVSGSITSGSSGQFTVNDSGQATCASCAAGTLAITSGNISDTGGAISFASANLTTTGSITAGASGAFSVAASDGDVTTTGMVHATTLRAGGGTGVTRIELQREGTSSWNEGNVYGNNSGSSRLYFKGYKTDAETTERMVILYAGSSSSENGRMYASDFYGTGVHVWSDDRCKHNEKSLESALATVNKLRVLEYLKTSEMYDADHTLDDPDAANAVKEVGVIAQDVQAIEELSHLVEETMDGEMDKLTLDYRGLFVYGLKAIQELSQQVDALTARVAQLESGT